MPVNLPAYPGKHFEKYNEAIENGFGAGKFAFAIDVWRDGAHLWRSYTDEECESLVEWIDREQPGQTIPMFAATPWACKGFIDAPDAYPVPTRAGLSTFNTSLRNVLNIAQAVLGIAMLPHAPSGKVISENTLRQRMHNHPEPWLVVPIHHDGVTIRLVMAEGSKAKPETAQYAADLTYWDDSVPQSDRVHYTGPSYDMTNPKDRKALSRQIKAEFDLTGHAGTVSRWDEYKYCIVSPTVKADLEIRKVDTFPADGGDFGPFRLSVD